MILIVDDDRDTRDLYVAALSFLGCRALAVPDAGRAYQQAGRRHPDVIVTDLVMPGDDGWTLIRSLKADPRTREIPVVVLTGHTAPTLPARARLEGCAAFLLKPCLPEQLLARVRQVVVRDRSGQYAD